MLKKIDTGRTFATYLMSEQPEAKEGKATIFHVRRLSHKEGIEWDLRQAKAIEDCKALDVESQARVLADHATDQLASVVERIENDVDIVEGVKEVKDFALEYMSYEQVVELCNRSKTGFLLAETDEELAKNG